MTAITQIKWRENVRIERIGAPDADDYETDEHYMDAETVVLRGDLIAINDALWWPRIKAEVSPMLYGGEDFRQTYFGYRGKNRTYAEWYRVLAYTIYGHGNWSNNDRRHNGLKPLRTRRKNRKGRR